MKEEYYDRERLIMAFTRTTTKSTINWFLNLPNLHALKIYENTRKY